MFVFLLLLWLSYDNVLTNYSNCCLKTLYNSHLKYLSVNRTNIRKSDNLRAC